MDDENREKFEQAGAMEYQERVRDYYLILREKDKEKNNQCSCMLYANGIAYLSYFVPENLELITADTITLRDVYTNKVGVEISERLGNDFDYNAAMVVTADLIAKYGVDSIISSSGSFEEDFGMTSDEYIKNYLDNKLYMHFLDE